MRAWTYRLIWMLPLLVAAAGMSLAQSQPQNLPDAPQPQKTVPPPTPPANPRSGTDSLPAVERRIDQPGSSTPQTKPPDPSSSKTAELYRLTANVNFVLLPVTVKDGSGRMVEGLLSKDFSVYEDGVRQKLNFFTSDPIAISAAVLVDVGMSDAGLRKVQTGLQALQGAFSQYDEVAVYTYGGSVEKQLDFNAVGDRLAEALNRIVEHKHGESGGVPISGGPMVGGPTVNGHPLDPSVPQVAIVPHDRRVLNDAVLEAALDLSKIDRSRRRVILIIGDGREDGSRASYADVLKILLSNQISVYAIAVDTGALPLYRKLERLNLPRTGTANILPKYANATGCEVFSEFTRQAIEQTYAAVTEEARNQYTLGYNSQGSLAGNYREIEVRVGRPGLKVFAKAGYYPLPPGRP